MTTLNSLPPTGTLRAGTAQVEITPPLGTHLAGSGCDHEVNFSYWAKLAPESLDRVVATAGGLLNELSGKSKECL